MIATVTTAPPVGAPKHSILDAANVIAGDGRWANGVTFTPVNCEAGHILTPNCPPPETTALDCTMPLEFKPVMLEYTYAWSTLDLAADPRKIAIDALDVATPRLLEHALWTGETLDPTNPAATVTVAELHPLDSATSLGSFSSYEDVLGAVINALADSSLGTGGNGVIHMNAKTALNVMSSAAFHMDGSGNLFTMFGMHRVVIGNYPDYYIAGHAGTIDLYLGEIDTVEHVEKSKNEHVVMASRAALMAYNACTAVVAAFD